MKRTFQFRGQPTRAQSTWLDNTFRLVREFYNAALQERIDAYKVSGVKVDDFSKTAKKRMRRDSASVIRFIKYQKPKSITKFDQMKSLTQVRAEHPEYAAFSVNACRGALEDLDNAFKAFFRRCKAGEKPGFPRFKSYRRLRQSLKFKCAVNWYKGKGNFGYVKAKGMPGKLRFKIHNPAFLREGVVCKTMTITRDHKGLLISFACEIPDVIPTITDDFIGVDVGIRKFLTTDDGAEVENPRLLQGKLKELRRRQRALSRKHVKGKRQQSGNYERARKDVVRLHAKVANSRKTFHFQTAAQLVNKALEKNCAIKVEDLNIKGLARSMLSRQVHDVGWGDFISRLSNKAESAGTMVYKVAPEYTSQDCSQCGKRKGKRLSDKVHECTHCGLILGRDHNAAINVKNRAVVSPIGANAGGIWHCLQNVPFKDSIGCGSSVAPSP